MPDRMREDVLALATPEGRMVGTPGHAAARRYLRRRINDLGLAPYFGNTFELAYGEGEIRLTNVIARLPGAQPDLPPVLIAAHYDTCGPYPGADDNASAIAIALAAVGPLREARLERDVLFAFFDAEEPPHFLRPTMGSTYFYTHQRRGPIHCAIVLDLVGHDVPVPGLEDGLFVLGMESDPGLDAVVRACEPALGPRPIATLNRYVGDMSDHHVFRINQRPYLFLTCGQWEHFHLPSDTPEKLNYEKIGRIRDYVIEVTRAVAVAALEGPFEGYDSTETELYFIRKHGGAIAEALGIELRGRSDIDALVQLMVNESGLLTGR
jgi:hypothetical protein